MAWIPVECGQWFAHGEASARGSDLPSPRSHNSHTTGRLPCWPCGFGNYGDGGAGAASAIVNRICAGGGRGVGRTA